MFSDAAWLRQAQKKRPPRILRRKGVQAMACVRILCGTADGRLFLFTAASACGLFRQRACRRCGAGYPMRAGACAIHGGAAFSAGGR